MKFAIWFLLGIASFSFATDYCAQASQDRFVHLLSASGKPGCYLEIGAYHPTLINNTYFLEKELGWKGVSIDISNKFDAVWRSMRTNALLIQDALKTDYASVLRSFPQIIDYLSLDIDAQYERVLQRIPLDKYRFRIITIEHDAYRFGSRHRDAERLILRAHGYHLLCGDVAMGTDEFEDWWIDPNLFSPEWIAQLDRLDLHHKDHKDLLKILSSQF